MSRARISSTIPATALVFAATVGEGRRSPRGIREPVTMRLALHLVASFIALCTVRGGRAA